MIESPPACACGASSYREILKIGERDEAPRFFAIAECTSCGLARTLPPPDPKQYEEGYAPTTRAARFAGSLSDLWSPQVARYVRDNSTGRSLLDVGCGVGNLVVAARNLGFDSEGIDIDPVATREASRQGRHVRTATLQQVAGPYDAVVVNHVLEHIEDLSDFLAHVSRVLSPGGRLFVFSPNREGLIARLRRDHWMGWVPREHVWHFTPSTLASTVERSSSLLPVATTSKGVIEGPVGGVTGLAVRALTLLSKSLGRGDQVEAIFERP
jgi:ubiquinone/menaquinone biosynthesis C-methylase UbiE